ncbi:MAG: FtsW/RodA/SpoVE family cell cycle protein [Firmicutes bacterium]|nr:FtsW/RodA/SpoVE family cell cycle protein [Bacillota bacterium]
MNEVPSYRSDLVLGSVAANCGIIGMACIIFCLLALCVYVFHISLKQKNALGCIVGCSCGMAIALQSLRNILIVFGVLPLMDFPLPFFATGFSFALVDYVLLGLVLSIYRYKDIRREKVAANAILRRAQ